MIPTIGLMVAAIGIARLLLVPIELMAHEKPSAGAWVVSLLAIFVLLLLSLDLVLSGASQG